MGNKASSTVLPWTFCGNPWQIPGRTARFQAADRLLESFLVGLADTHDFAYSSICVPSLSSTPLNFSKAQRANLITM